MLPLHQSLDDHVRRRNRRIGLVVREAKPELALECNTGTVVMISFPSTVPVFRPADFQLCSSKSKKYNINRVYLQLGEIQVH